MRARLRRSTVETLGYDALVDSGSALTVFPREAATDLGISDRELARGPERTIIGAGGGMVRAYAVHVDLVLSAAGTVITLTAVPVFFAERLHPSFDVLLGQLGVFDRLWFILRNTQPLHEFALRTTE